MSQSSTSTAIMASTMNTSQYSNSTEKLSLMSDLGRDIVIALHTIIFFLSVTGNGLVITTLARNKRMRTVTNVFLFNLAVSDLLVSVVCMPFTIVPVLMQEFVFGEELCIIVRYLQGSTVAASAFTLVAISLERYFAICRPLQARKWQVLSHSYKMILIIWVAALSLNGPLAAFHKVTVSKGVRQCQDIWPTKISKEAWYTFQLLVVDLVAPLVIMSVTYSMIAKALWHDFEMIVLEIADGSALHRKQSDSAESDRSDETERFSVKPQKKDSTQLDGHVTLRSHHGAAANSKQSKKKVVKMLFVIVLEFFVCWTPLYVVTVWYMVDGKNAVASIRSPTVVISALRLLSYMSSCCNPITYCFMSKKFRTAFLTAFRCRKAKAIFDKRFQSTQISYCEGPRKA